MPVVDEARDPSLENLLELYGDVLRDQIHVMLPGKIVSYDADKQMATVQPLVKTRRLAEDGDTVVPEDRPPIHNCPVEFCGPARGRITWPVAAGDICEIRFSSASLARWTGLAPGSTVDPGNDDRHELTDAICFVGLHSPASAPTDAPTDAVVVHLSGGIVLKLGSSSASESAVKGDAFQTALNTFLDALKVWVDAVATATGVTSTTLDDAISTMKSASYKSSTVKLE